VLVSMPQALLFLQQVPALQARPELLALQAWLL
jgi:hypothetical protein